MKNEFNKILALIAVALVIFAVDFYWDNLRGASTVFSGPKKDIVTLLDDSSKEITNSTDFPLNLPAGFKIEIFAKNVDGARDMAFDGFGNLWVSRSKSSAVTLLEIKNGKVVSQNDIFKNLDTPHGLAIDPDNDLMLYIAEENRVSRVALYSEDRLNKVLDLPTPIFGGHTSRTIRFGPDGRLYISVGSTCNVCQEKDPRFAAMYSVNKDGGDFQMLATGLRNSVFFDWNPGDDKLWATDMGRDRLGDNIPPDEINLVEQGNDYGWPYCYGRNIMDPFNTFGVACSTKTPSKVDLPAHSAPLGIGFVPATKAWPEEMQGNMIVAFHGSWNRSEPTGYKLVRVVVDDQNNFVGIHDFITGWLQDGEALGRPVGVLFRDGALYVSDDFAGVIYKITY
ncbi:MAG: PQQ-dependent sugar dehydrogenase [Candidatus Doudnabacteria bacterium]|nr:PQQ-dependent sugar dehydrogenase [Candidatus Doudnabacteria bacterium]